MRVMLLRSTAQSSWGDILADRCKYGRTIDTLVTYLHVSAHTFTHACTHVRTAGVRAHTHTHPCVQASISVYFCSQKTHSHLNAGDRTHLPALWAARQLSQNILYTHARIRLPGVPHMQRPGSAKWNFLKAKNTSPEQTSLLNNTTLGFLPPLLRQAVIIYKGRVFGMLFRERSCWLFLASGSLATRWIANRL